MISVEFLGYIIIYVVLIPLSLVNMGLGIKCFPYKEKKLEVGLRKYIKVNGINVSFLKVTDNQWDYISENIVLPYRISSIIFFIISILIIFFARENIINNILLNIILFSFFICCFSLPLYIVVKRSKKYIK